MDGCYSYFFANCPHVVSFVERKRAKSSTPDLGLNLSYTYSKAFARGDAGSSVPIWVSTAYLVGVNMIAAGIINTAKTAFFDETHKRKTQIIRGNPFQHSRDFAERFHRAAMPVAVGGDLSTGDDGHCCVGGAHTALTDEDSIATQLEN